MTEQEQLLPDMPDESLFAPDFLREDNWFDVDIAPYVLDFNKQYEAPRYTLSWKGIPFAPLGGIQAITGQAGNGKTMTLAQFMAAILKGEFGELRYELGGIIERPVVLYIDTEMEEANTISVKNRVMTMCGRPIDETCDDFKVVMLREMPASVDKTEKGREVKVPASVMRWRATLKAIWMYKPTVCFIDGLLDVVADFNDNKECQEIIYKCMQTASNWGMSLWCIVHQNPGSEKLVGHLGSFIERKVTDVFAVKKDKNEKTAEATFTVSQKKARGRDVGDWKFRVLPIEGWGMPEQIDTEATATATASPKADRPEDIIRWLTDGQNDIEWPAYAKEVKSIFKNRGNVSANDQLQADLEVAKKKGYIRAQESIEYEPGQRFPKYILNRNELLPF